MPATRPGGGARRQAPGAGTLRRDTSGGTDTVTEDHAAARAEALGERAIELTQALLALLGRTLRLAAPALRVPGVPGLVTAADGLVREALFGDSPQDSPARER